MIHVENLTKSFRDLRRGLVVAVDNVSFDAKPGEIFGLLGPNGAGKTTTMRILCTVLKPSGGQATIAGCDVATQPSLVRQHIGFLSANTAIYDRMSAWELVEYFGKLYGMDDERLRARMEHVFDSLRMNDFRDVLGAKMSTGMRQKVSIARAIVHDPPVLIFDEPTAGLDVLVARNVLENIRQLREQGKCILYSTHIMREVEKICDRVAIVGKGKVRACGTLQDLREQHGENDMEELFFRLVS
ncbi:MAG: ATP-binding cassette domain-containing protein [Gemmataceae bacterium]|nr:ATP-binding cassette domain-containing protein [Gemmataceae bacterium]MCI0739926.1 ATP-binding cassette domain-containing protein [Gemmataceae bacterium]